jgi:PAS domain S-box-containing protein
LTTLSEAGLVLAPIGRDAQVAAAMLADVKIDTRICSNVHDMVANLKAGAGFAILTEEAIATADVGPLADWIQRQAQWSDFPIILLIQRGGGLERNPAAGRYLETLGNVTFLERPFHPTTLISLSQSALRTRRRQYDARTLLRTLHDNEQQFRSLADSIPTLCWMAEPNGHIFWYNQQWYDYTGTQPAEMQGWGWQSVHGPDMLAEVLVAYNLALTTGNPLELVFPLRSAEGSYRPFLTRMQPVRDAMGNVTRWFGTNTDITTQRAAEEALRQTAADLELRVEERTAEREAITAQLHEAQKLETLGQLTGGVAHDFNNLLTPIMGALELLQRKYGDQEPSAARWIGNALQATDRARTLTQRLLGFARRQELKTSATDVDALLRGMEGLIKSSAGPEISVGIDITGEPASAMIDAGQLELAVLNLCVNARDAMPDGGTLVITLEETSVADKSGLKLEPGRYLRLSIIDSGCGMDAETLKRAVEPFYSTKETGRGTGLGLSMVHGLAAQLNGTFELSSEIGQGTRAELWLPVTEEKPVARPDEHDLASLPIPHALTVMLVDDEELVRSGTADMMRALGHEVIEAESGAEALVLLGKGVAPDLLVTDFKMPAMNGPELIRRARRAIPDLPALLITGYTGVTTSSENVPRLSKPFGQAEIAAAMASVVRDARRVITPLT